MFAGNFAPAGWLFCEGQLLAIAENDALFQLIGTTYGGDGQTTFALPDLRSRIPVHAGNTYILAETGGAEEITLTTSQIPSHQHVQLAASVPATHTTPNGRVLARPDTDMYASATPTTLLAAVAMAPNGGSQSHTNLQPGLCINFIISLFGIFPSPT